MKWLTTLLFLFLVYGNTAGQECCKFDISYLLLGSELPPDEDLQRCAATDGCTAFYYLSAKMLRAFENEQFDSVDYFFHQLILEHEAGGTAGENILKIAYLYAKYLEITGQNTYAATYYKYLTHQAANNDMLSLLAYIGFMGIEENAIKITELFHSFPERLELMPDSTPEEKLIAVDRFCNYSSLEDQHYAILDQNYELLQKRIDSKVSYLIMSLFAFVFSQYEDPRAHELIELVKGSPYEVRNAVNPHLNTILSINYLKDLNYQKSLEHAKLALVQEIGPFSSTEELLNIMPRVDIDYLDKFYKYARSMLYQTRVGGGLPPVKDAFTIYETGYRLNLETRVKTANSLVSERPYYFIQKYINLLIIGTYLYQNTGEIDYLNRSVAVMDASIDPGGQFWLTARPLMRKNPAFAADLKAEQAATRTIQNIDSTYSLSQIFALHQGLERQRKALKEDFPEFYAALTSGMHVDLPELQEDLREEAAGVVAFYLTEDVLYRLLVTPDTIDILPLNHVLGEVLSQRNVLTELIHNGQPASATEAPSRALYAALFGGIDALLPERLHIIAGGELANVPFAALRRDTAGTSPRYLGLECALSRQFSIRGMQLLKALELAPRHAQPLGMAPSFDNNFLAASELRQAGYKLPPLLYNAEEVRHLKSQSAGKYFSGPQATLARYEENAADYSILHLATHAISSQTDGLKSRIYLLDEEGAPTSLYAADVGEQTLNADLVVLSACETGTGGLHVYEGRVGLTKAYLAAGARAVVASDWSVDDHATATLMQVFYDSLAVGQTPDLALRDARRAYLAKFPGASPYKWAAFDAYGGMVAPKWEKTGNWLTSSWQWLLVGVLAALGLLFYQRRRYA